MAVGTVAEKKRRGRPPANKQIGVPGGTHANGAAPEFDEGGEPYHVPAGVRGMPPGENFWEQLAGFEPREWDSELIGYLWRISPIHDRRFAGKPTSIAKYSRPFDLETIKNEHGSGGYRIDLSRIPGNGGKQTRIGQEYFQIMDIDKPPRMPAGDWIDWPENELWKWAGPALRQKAAEAQQAAAAATGGVNQPQDGTRMFNTILEGVRTLRGEQQGNNDLAIALLEMVQADRAKQAEINDPAKQLLTIKSLMEALIPKQDNSAFTMIVTMMQADLKFQRETVNSLREQLMNRPDPITSLIEMLPRLTPVLEVLGFKSGARAAVAPGTDWGGIISNVVDKLSDHVPAILETVKIAKSSGPAADTKAVQPWKPGVVTEAPKPAAAAAAAPDPDEPPEVKEARAKMAQADKDFGVLIRACLPHMLDCYRNLTGYDFRDWMIDRKGRDQWLALKEKVGSVTLVQLAMAVPQLAAQLSPPEKFHAFMEEVFTEVGKEAADRLSPLPDGDDEPDEETLEAERRLNEQIHKARQPEIIMPTREGARV